MMDNFEVNSKIWSILYGYFRSNIGILFDIKDILD